MRSSKIANIAPLPLHTAIFLLAFGVGQNRFFLRLPARQGAFTRILASQTGTGIVIARFLRQHANLARVIVAGFGKLLNPFPGNLVRYVAGTVGARGFLAAVLIVDLQGIQLLAQLGVRLCAFLIE